MILTTSTDTYAVHFRHVDLSIAATRVTHITECAIHAGKCFSGNRPCMTLGETYGCAQCCHLDNFNRAKGRKIAFGRALSPLPKDVRTSLWRAYLTKFPPTD